MGNMFLGHVPLQKLKSDKLICSREKIYMQVKPSYKHHVQGGNIFVFHHDYDVVSCRAGIDEQLS